MKPCSEMLLEVTVYCGKVRDQRGCQNMKHTTVEPVEALFPPKVQGHLLLHLRPGYDYGYDLVRVGSGQGQG